MPMEFKFVVSLAKWRARILQFIERPGFILVTQPKFKLESLILAQNERWRSASDMQVERESRLRLVSKVAHG